MQKVATYKRNYDLHYEFDPNYTRYGHSIQSYFYWLALEILNSNDFFTNTIPSMQH